MALSFTVSVVAVVLLLLLAGEAEGKPCSQKELRVFETVTPQVQACTTISGLRFQMPPQQSLPMTAQNKLCKAPSCTHMLGLVDDLELPRCEIFFDNKNVTLQNGVDLFAALCDNVSSTPLPVKKKSSSSSSSSSSGAYGRKRKEKVTASAAARAVESYSLVLAVVATGLALMASALL